MTPDEHRALGVELYNKTWELLDEGAAPVVVVDAVFGRFEPALHHAE